MSNNGFFSHYPFFTPPPQTADEALETGSEDGDQLPLRELLIFPEGVVPETLKIL